MMRLALFVVLMLCARTAFAADQPRYAPPPAWASPAPLPQTFSTPTQTPARWLLADQQLEFDHGTTRRYQETLVRIQTPQGLDEAGTITLLWDPATEILTIHKLHILRANTVIDVLGTGQSFTILRRENNLEGAELDGRLTAVIQPAGLQLGDILDLSYTVDQTDPVMHGMAEWMAGFATDTPVDHLRLRATWPTSTPIQFRASPTLPPPQTSIAHGQTSLSWSADNVQPLVQPELAPSRFLQERQVAFSQFASWSEVARQFAPLYDHAEQLTPQSPLLAEIARIKAASPDPAARATAALALVQDRIRYVFLAMNDGGLVPANADLTWQRRFGDCKGKTVLLLALLHGLGIEAAPVLVNTQQGDGLPVRLPGVSLFDHVLTHAVIDGRPYWLDGTRTGDSTLANIAIPAFTWGLKLAPDTTALLPITPEPPTQPLEATTLRIDASAGLDKPAPFHGELLLRGDYAIVLNQQLTNLTPEEQDRTLRHSWSGRYDSVDVDTVSAAFDPATGQEKLVMDGHTTMRWTNHRYEADDAGPGYDAHFERTPGSAHDAPYKVDFPHFQSNSETILLPPHGLGYAIDGTNRDEIVAGAHYLQKSAIQNNVFVLQTEVRSLAPEFPAAQAALRDMSQHTIYLRSFPIDATTTPAMRELLKAAAHDLDQGHSDAAIATCNKLLVLDSGQASAFAIRGIALLNKGSQVLASEDFAAAEALDPNNAIAARGRGLMALQLHDLLGAIKHFSQSLDADPRNTFTLYKRADAYAALGDDDMALADMDLVVAAAPGDAKGYMQRGVLFAKLGQNDKALADLNRAATLAPGSARVIALLGLAHYLILNDPAGAAQDFARAARIDPQDIKMRRGRGLLAFDAGNFAAAIPDLSAALLQDTGTTTDQATILDRRARCELALHQDVPALADTDRLLQLTPGHFDVYYLRARIDLDRGDKPAALQEAHAAITAGPASPAAYTTAGAIYAFLRQDTEAAGAFSHSLAIAPTAAAYLDRAMYRPFHDLAGRAGDIAAALTIDPNSVPALGMRAGMQEQAGDYSGLLPTVQALIAISGPTADLLGFRGLAYAKTGQARLAAKDFAVATASAVSAHDLNDICWHEAVADMMLNDALKTCATAVARAPGDAQIIDSRGFVLLRLHRYPDAIAAYDAALKIAPQQADSLYGRGIVEQRMGRAPASAADLKSATGLDDKVAGRFASYGVSP